MLIGIGLDNLKEFQTIFSKHNKANEIILNILINLNL